LSVRRIVPPVVAGVALLAILALWRPSLVPAQPAVRTSFDAKLVQQGAQLAALGNCAGCHTRTDGRSFAGGVPLETPFGTIVGTNITPDPDTGIGAWSQEAFNRAMREGIADDGRHLYPAFPYDHFRHVADDDLRALYAFLLTRDPVRAQRPENALRFPFNIRPLLAFWNLLFLDKSALRQDASQSAQWNRGAYLVDGLAHCGACHTPRNGLGAEEKKQYLGGGEAEGWYAPALNEQSPSPLPWTLEELKTYLRTGIAERHAIAGGPMQEVVYNLSQVPEEEVAAIATYIHSMMGAARGRTNAEHAGRALAGSNPQHPGEPVYAGSCASCHEAGRQLSSAGALRRSRFTIPIRGASFASSSKASRRRKASAAAGCPPSRARLPTSSSWRWSITFAMPPASRPGPMWRRK
jgi:mono/diheme cytochrome c family protein